MVRRRPDGHGRGLPADPEVPALRAIAHAGVEETLRRLGLPAPFDDVVLLKHHATSRATFAFRAAGRPLVAKAYRSGVGEQVALLAALERHGLATGRAPTAPPLVAYDSELHLVVTGHLEGVQSTALIQSGARAGELAADWLIRQWAAPIDLGARYDAASYVRRLGRNAAVVNEAAPALRGATAAVLQALAVRPPELREPVLTHGAFSINNIMDMGAGAGVVDWDGFCQGARELDAATFLATLARDAGRREDLGPPAAAAAEAFRTAVAGALDSDTFAWYEAGALLRNARHLCAVKPAGWLERAERLLAEARALAAARAW